jgi:hypothetical protein
MPLKDGVAEAVAHVVDSDVKLVHFFKEYDTENKKMQEMVELQLENFLIGLGEYERKPYEMDNVDLSSLINVSYQLMINALRAAKRGYDNKIRQRMIWVIVLVERYKQVPKRWQSVRGIKNLLLLFKSLYTHLIDKHIRLTTLIEDDLVLNIKKLSTQTASIFDEAMRDLVDSEESVDGAKAATDKAKQETSASEDILDQYFLK